tara:strand:+ start:208 stop:453 length:246 start_codon:yes stop_codon:yes gene_type:complete
MPVTNVASSNGDLLNKILIKIECLRDEMTELQKSTEFIRQEVLENSRIRDAKIIELNLENKRVHVAKKKLEKEKEERQRWF